MSLIESALARARGRSGGSETASPAPSSRTPSAAARSTPAAAAAPVERIVAPYVPVDAKACDEHRVLLDDTAVQNHDAVAAYRILRTRILHRARARGWTTIGITSAGPNDGKSLTSLNLSLSLAPERNSEVVLLDMDMRNPSVCRCLGVEPPIGMLEYLERRATPRDVFFSIGVDNLTIASGNTATEQASELLGTTQFEDLIHYVKQHTANPIILIDLPPLLSTDDALVIAPRVDAMLLVVAEGITDRSALSKAVELLSEFPMAGLVLNRAVEAQAHGYGYGIGKG